MTTDDLHEVTFIWCVSLYASGETLGGNHASHGFFSPESHADGVRLSRPRTDAASVVLTGTFDNWSKSIPLTKSLNGFTGSIKLPWNKTIAYKYIVDGNWSLDDSKPKRVELGGYVNNVYVAPSKPSSPQETPVPVKALSEIPMVHLNGTMNGIKTEHTGDASAAQVPEGTEVEIEVTYYINGSNFQKSELIEIRMSQIPDELQPKIHGHLEMSEPLQAAPVQGADKAGDLGIEEGMKSIPVDRHPAEGGGTATAELGVDKEEGISQAENPKEDEKPLEAVPEPAHELAETAKPTPPTGLTSPKAEQEVSQVASSSGIATSVPEERKRSPIMSFVPVNVPPEVSLAEGSLQNDTHGVSGEETSTHKPLRPVSKIPQLPTATSEAAAGPAEQSDAKQTTGETPVKPEGAITETGPSQGATEESPADVSQAAAEPEEKADIPPATAPAPATQLPQSALTEVPQPDATGPTQPVADEKPSDILSTAPLVTTPVKGAEASADTTKTPEPAAVVPAPVPTETTPAGKSPSAPSSPTKPRFPRVSRESSASEPPQNGKARKRKSTFLEKIKHIFSHEKDKGKGKSKSKK
ncbi:hypothetical protein JOM56_008341 [Amanita muscaria]